VDNRIVDCLMFFSVIGFKKIIVCVEVSWINTECIKDCALK